MASSRYIRDKAERRIAELERDGVEQITDPAAFKTMSAAQLVQARREGRLTGLLAGLYDKDAAAGPGSGR